MWHSNKFLNSITDVVVLPILRLNGDKISNPTVFASIEHDALEQFLRGRGWKTHLVEGDEPVAMQQLKHKLTEHNQCINRRGEDMPEIRDWRWDKD